MSEEVVIVTGGTGFIGGHTVVRLLEGNRNVVIIDNLRNSYKSVIDAIETITSKKIYAFHEVDITDREAIINTLGLYKNRISCVIHFAGLKAVGESVTQPVEYYKNNVGGTVNLLEAMQQSHCKSIIFSSSATVYGDPAELPIKESTPLGETTNPYGTSKAMIEQILTDVYHADNSFNVCLLRYFNPIGAHPTGLIGERTKGVPNNLLPYVAQVCTGQRPNLKVFGTNYNTVDGTGVRDYIHVVDLADGHVKALDYIKKHPGKRSVFNLGTGKGYSVLQVVKAMEKASGKHIPLVMEPRRSGDVASCYADCSLAESELGWKTKFEIDQMCKDLWNYCQKLEEAGDKEN